MARILPRNLHVKITMDRNGEKVERELDLQNADVSCDTTEDSAGNRETRYVIKGCVISKTLTYAEIIKAIENWWGVFTGECYNTPEDDILHDEIMDKLQELLGAQK